MMKFIDKVIKKYVNKIRISKWNVVKFASIFTVFVGITSFSYNKRVNKLPSIDSAIIAGGIAIIMGIMWAIFSIMFVTDMDKRRIKEEDINRKIINDIRLKTEIIVLGRKIDNKKKKMYRKLLEEEEITRRENKKDVI
ncbi:hypothetical protein [Clostridium vincentii]|uniref:Uncharacterized protein n=1 Tax=Clostridium vincentii TaxID=52704 RepID=A0A2T0BJ80_9CLOT|nr:hypothetical protein [Clostridium vincentii]PRR83903.1 hypothetical protein CLVI_05570 [Clostridium vincentii]